MVARLHEAAFVGVDDGLHAVAEAPAQAAPHLDAEDDAPGWSEQAGHPSTMVTEGKGCWEGSTVHNASAAEVQAALPQGWRPYRNVAGFALTQFVDYVCEAFSIEGDPPRRTLVSLLGGIDGTGGSLTR